MLLRSLDKIPEDCDSDYYDHSYLDEYDKRDLEGKNITCVVYWYGQGCYEGSGEMLFKVGDLWGYHNMGHCSCYGPVEQLEISKLKTLEELYDSFSEELKQRTSELFTIAKQFI